MAAPDTLTSLLTAVGASSGNGPAAINPAPTNSTVADMLKAYAPQNPSPTTSLNGPLVPPGTPAPTPAPPAPASASTGGANITTPTGSTDTTGTSNPLKARLAMIDQTFAKDAGGADPDDLSKKASDILNPAASARAALLGQGQPQYQATRVNPLLLLGLAGLGAIANRTEYRGPNPNAGANFVNGPLGAIQANDQQRFQQAQDQYKQQLENSAQSYALAKDRAQPLLDQANQAQGAQDANEQNRRAAIIQAIGQDTSMTHEEKMQALQYAQQKDLQSSSERAAANLQKSGQDFQQHFAMLDNVLKNGTKDQIAAAYRHDALGNTPTFQGQDGKIHAAQVDATGNELRDASGNPIIDKALDAQADKAEQNALTKTPQDLINDLNLKLGQQKLSEAQKTNQMLEFSLEHQGKDWALNRSKILSDMANSSGQLGVQQGELGLNKMKFGADTFNTDQDRQIQSAIGPAKQYQAALEDNIKQQGLAQKMVDSLNASLTRAKTDDERKSLNAQIATAQSDLTALQGVLPTITIDKFPAVPTKANPFMPAAPMQPGAKNTYIVPDNTKGKKGPRPLAPGVTVTSTTP